MAATTAPLTFLQVGPVQGPAGLAQIVDERQRSVLLRGVNVNGLVDYFRSDARPPYPTTVAAYAQNRCPLDDLSTTAVPLCARDLSQLAALGASNLRLPVSWSLLEPTPGKVDGSYIDRIGQVVGWAKSHGIWTTIDLHQDGWSKYLAGSATTLCPPGSTVLGQDGDGAPAWAALHLAPSCAPGGVKEASPAVQEAAQRFWSNLPAPDGLGLQDHYAHVVAVLAQRFVDEPAVAGYDLMNEPQPGVAAGAFDNGELLPFYAKVIAAVRTSVPRFHQLFFLEPGGQRNVTAARSFATPWSALSSYRGAVYAPHIYTGVFTADTILGGPRLQTSDSDYGNAVADAKALGLPLWIGEFGNTPSDDRSLLDPQYQHQDANAVGGTLWCWKEHGSWGAYAPPYDQGGVPRTARLQRMATAYPMLTAGVLDSLAENPFTGQATVTAHSAKVAYGDRSRGTLIVLPASFAGVVHVTGATAQVVRVSGGREVWLWPTGGPYRLVVG